MSKGSDDLTILLLALVALAAVIGWAMMTSSDGAEPIPLPTVPTTTVTLDE